MNVFLSHQGGELLPVNKATALMGINKIHTLPVVRDGKIIRVVNLIKHIMNVLAKK